MNKINDITDNLLERPELKANPFRMPEGYLENLENSVMEAVTAKPEAEPEKEVGGFWAIAKPAILLAAMFALIFGMGYGVLSLTGTLDRGSNISRLTWEEPIAEIDAGYINSSFIDFYDNSESEAEPSIGSEFLVDYLSSELSTADIAEIYAQLK